MEDSCQRTMAMTHDPPRAQVQPNRVSFNSMMSAFEKGHQWEMATWIYASKCCCCCCCCFLEVEVARQLNMNIYIQSHGIYGFETSRFLFQLVAGLVLLVVFVVVVGCCWLLLVLVLSIMNF